ncbi:MAG: GNAT family N-acetyltransferase [Dongiaceae bacterium]
MSNGEAIEPSVGSTASEAGGSTVTIRPAAGVSDIETIRALFLEYAATLDFSLCFQGFDAELANLPGDYAPPQGGLWLAELDGASVGCVALRPIESGVCEIKRLYLRPAARGRNLGRRLTETVLEHARARDYRAMRLDTVDAMVAAQSLYRALGFHEIEPYGDHRHSRLRYFELALAPASG